MGLKTRLHLYAELVAAVAGAIVMPRMVLKDEAGLWLEILIDLIFAGAFILLVNLVLSAEVE